MWPGMKKVADTGSLLHITLNLAEYLLIGDQA